MGALTAKSAACACPAINATTATLPNNRFLMTHSPSYSEAIVAQRSRDSCCGWATARLKILVAWLARSAVSLVRCFGEQIRTLQGFDLAKRKQGCPPEASSTAGSRSISVFRAFPSERWRDVAPPHCPQPTMAGLVSHLRTGEKRPFSLRSVKSARRSGLRQDAPTSAVNLKFLSARGKLV